MLPCMAHVCIVFKWNRNGTQPSLSIGKIAYTAVFQLQRTVSTVVTNSKQLVQSNNLTFVVVVIVDVVVTVVVIAAVAILLLFYFRVVFNAFCSLSLVFEHISFVVEINFFPHARCVFFPSLHFPFLSLKINNKCWSLSNWIHIFLSFRSLKLIKINCAVSLLLRKWIAW